MAKYIDDRLRAMIMKYESTAENAYNPSNEDADYWHGKVVACEDILHIINSLQQEQQEVDLEEEIDEYWQNWLSPSNQKEVEGVLPKTEFAMYAHHFYELGKNSK